jgi:CheY-like chemotaxis protein
MPDHDDPRRPRALVVDDDDATRTLVCELLKRLRFEAVDGATRRSTPTPRRRVRASRRAP